MGISDIIGGLLKPVGDYFSRRQEIKATEHQNQVELIKAQGERTAKLVSEGLAADAQWEATMAGQAGNSWKDEWTLLVVSTPLVMAFIPGLSSYVVAGFAAFSGTPLWYQIMVQTIFYATYGIRFWRRSQSDT